MRDLVQVLASELEHLRLFLHGDDAQADNVAEVAQAAPADRADPARAAGDEAANGGGVSGGGVHSELLAGVLPRGLVEIGADDAGAADHPAGLDFADVIHVCKAQNHAAGQRHRLAVIAGACAARRDRNVVAIAGLEHADQLGFGFWRDHEIAGDMIKLALEQRRIPVEVPALLLDNLVIVLDPESVKLSNQRFNVHWSGAPSNGPVRSSPAAPHR
jgi:hypothetical protein